VFDTAGKAITTISPGASQMRLSPDRLWLYFYMGQGNRQSIYRLNTGTLASPAHLIDNACYSNAPVFYAVDERQVAYTAADGSARICIFDLATLTPSALNVEGYPFAFSPDGSKLLFSHLDMSPALLTIGTGEIEEGPGGTASWDLRWDETGMRSITGPAGYGAEPIEFYIYNYRTGLGNRLIVPCLYAWAHPYAMQDLGKAWSNDEARIAFFEGGKTAPNSVHYALRVVSVATNRTDSVATANAFPGAVAFSGDSKAIVYNFGGSVYYKNLP
jgi:hypothetical protein